MGVSNVPFLVDGGEIELLNSCPVCEGSEFERISTVFVGDLAFFSTDFCRSCGLVFRRTRPAISWFKKVWELRDRNQKQAGISPVNEELEKRRYIRYRNLAQVLEQIVSGRKMVDIGTGPATGLKAFHDRSWIATGVEPNPARARVGREKYGLNIIECTVEEYSEADGSYDVATCIHSLEHFHSPLGWLQHVVRLVGEGGCVYIEVPDLMNYVRWNDSLYLAHMNNFTKETLALLGSRAGLRPCYRLFPKTNPNGVTHLGILFQKTSTEGSLSYGLNAQDLSNLLIRVKDLYANGLPATPGGIIQFSIPEVTDAVLGFVDTRRQESWVYSESGGMFYFHSPSLVTSLTAGSRMMKAGRLRPKALGRKIARKLLRESPSGELEDTEDKDFFVLRFEPYS